MLPWLPFKLIFNLDCSLDEKLVIPAQAGIQLIDTPAKRDGMAVLHPQGVRCWVPALRATLPLPASQRVLLLDSRLRGNDEADGQSGFKVILSETAVTHGFARLMMAHQGEMLHV